MRRKRKAIVQPLFWGGIFLLAGGVLVYATPGLALDLDPGPLMLLGLILLATAGLIDVWPDLKRYLEIRRM